MLFRIPQVGVQRRKHSLLAGVRGAQTRAEHRKDWGEGAHHLRGFHFDSQPQGSKPRLARPRNHQQQHGEADSDDFRRSAESDLHAHATRLLPQVYFHESVQENPQLFWPHRRVMMRRSKTFNQSKIFLKILKSCLASSQKKLQSLDLIIFFQIICSIVFLRISIELRTLYKL